MIMKPTIEYLNARKAIKAASGGAKQDCSAKYLPDRDLDLCERTELQCDGACRVMQLQNDVMWQVLFERFGFTQGYDIGETF